MAKKVVVDIEVNSKKGVKEVSNLNKEISKTGDSLNVATNSLDKFSGGAVSKFKNFKGAVSSLSNGFKSLKVAIIGTGIGALLIGILAVKAAFTSSEEGQNKFAKLMGVIGSITGNLVDMLASLGNGIISVFENPKQAILDFKDLLISQVTNRIDSVIETVGFLGSAFKKVFSGDFSGALDDAKKAGSSYVDTLTGVKNSIDKVSGSVKGMVSEMTKEAKIASNIADQRAKADKLDRKLTTERAEANRKRAELLDKAANKEKFTAKERIEFLKEAGKVDEDITNKEIASAKLRLDAKIEENKLSGSTKDDLNEEANLKAKLIDLETARLTKAKLVTSQIVGANREEVASNKAKLAERTADEKAADDAKALREKEVSDEKIRKAKTLADLEKEIREAEAVTADERRALELEKIGEHYDKLIAQAEAFGIDTVKLEEAKAKAIDKANGNSAKNEVAWADMSNKSKLGIAKKTLGNLTEIAGKESAAGKATAIASATIDTYQSATSAFKSMS